MEIELTTKEMRQITGIEANNLPNYCDRGHLETNGEKYSKKRYPLSALNKSFIQQHGKPGSLDKVIKLRNQVKKETKKNKPKPPSKPKKKPQPKPVKPKPKAKEPEKIKPEPIEHELSPLAKANLRQKELAIEKAELQMRQQKIELEKVEGNFIDIEKTANIIRSYSENNARILKREFTNLITEICSRSSVDSTRYLTKIGDIINKSNAESVRDVETLLSE